MALAANSSQNKYNTSTGKLNPNYKGGSRGGSGYSTMQIKNMQSYLNSRGANLAIDGKLGPLTSAAMARYGVNKGGFSSGGKGNTVANAGNAPKLNATSQAASYNKGMSGGGGGGGGGGTTSTKPAMFGNPFAGGAKNYFKSVLGGLGIVGGGIKDALSTVANASGRDSQSANAKFGADSSSVVPGVDWSKYSKPDAKADNSYAAAAARQAQVQLSLQNKNPNLGEQAYKDYVYNNSLNTLQSGLLDPNAAPITTPITNGGAPTNTYTATAPTETTPTPAPASTTPSSTLAAPGTAMGDLSANPVSFVNPATAGGIGGAQNAIMGINADVASLQGQGSAWDYDKGKMVINNRTGAWTDNLAKNFTNPNDFTNAYNTNLDFKTKIDGLSKYNITAESITNKIGANAMGAAVAVNGIQPAQSAQDYLTNLAGIPKFNTGDKVMDANYTQQALLTKGWNDQMIEMYKGDHDTIGIMEQDKITAQQTIDLMTEKEANREASVRERADYMMEKERAAWKKADAEVEINRINGKNSLVGLLASLGALDTSGQAGNAIVTLDQKYQAQRQELRSNYEMGVREINMQLNDNINSLQEGLDDGILKINSDLSKSERDINLELMKMTHDTQKDMLSLKIKADERLIDKREKAAAKAASYSNAYNNSLWNLMTKGNIPLEVARGMINSSGDIQPTQTNLDITKYYNAPDLPEKTPAYKGETLSLGTNGEPGKIISEYEKLGYGDTDQGYTNLINIQNLLNQGWSLEQISKNYPMPTDVFNLIKSYIKTP